MRRVRRPLVALIALLAALAVGYTVRAADKPSATIPTVSLKSLPPQVTAMVQRIADGGPFRYPHGDGIVFHNDEHLLPDEPDGYYREYTVPTPGLPEPGSRCIVTAGKGTFYYTPDHDATFERLALPR